jgi:hypothetical protein
LFTAFIPRREERHQESHYTEGELKLGSPELLFRAQSLWRWGKDPGGFSPATTPGESIAGSKALTSPDHPVLVLDPLDDGRRPFRCIPPGLWGAENNLNIANMDWVDFADAVDEGGVFRAAFMPYGLAIRTGAGHSETGAGENPAASWSPASLRSCQVNGIRVLGVCHLAS